MMYILLVTGLIATVTVAVLMVISADLSAGIRQLQAVRVFHTAEAGIHHAMAKLQQSGATTYTGETITIADGATTVGTAVITVGCIDGAALPCYGAYAGHRRIVSAGSLPEGGPTRTVVAVVDVVPDPYALCGEELVDIEPRTTIYGDLGSNDAINLKGLSTNYSRVRADPPPPSSNYGTYGGNATAVGAITCDQGCPTQVQGVTTPFAAGPVCAATTAPTITPGSSNQTVTTAGWTMDSTTGYSWRDIDVEAAGTETDCDGPTPFSDLRIQTGAAGTTTVVHLRNLDMGRCGRLVILGEGNLELRVAQVVRVRNWSRFGVLPTDSIASPAPIPARRFTVYLGPNPPHGGQVEFDGARLVSGTFIVPGGEWEWHDMPPTVAELATIYGTVKARTIRLGDDDQDLTFIYDGPPLTSPVFSRFRSWKDQ